jgi:DNA-binding GntR family transcriptional regulator
MSRGVGAGWTFAQLPDVVLFSGMSSNAKVVFAALHKYSTMPKGAIPSHATLSERLGISVSTVRRSIDELVAEGFLHIEHRHGTSSRYTLLIGEQTSNATLLTYEQTPRSRVNRGSAHGWTTNENEGITQRERDRSSFSMNGPEIIPGEDLPF